jgi:hypothetical protein
MHEIRLFPKRDNKLGFLCPCIETMFATIDAYIDYHCQTDQLDVPYGYNERATLSILAGAIWRNHPSNLVLEEFSMEKSWSKASYKGRQDIWFRVSKRECFGEAKQQWIPLSKVRTEAESYLAILESETSLAKQNLRNPKKIALGILFLVPSIRIGKIEHARKNLEQHYKVLESAVGPWCEKQEYEVLWGKYSRDQLLEEKGCSEWSDGTFGSCPSLDTLICTSAK